MQGRENTPLCPRCNTTIETPDHFFTCSAPDAIANRQELLQSFLLELERIFTAPALLTIFEYKISIVLHLPLYLTYQNPHPLLPNDNQIMLNAVRHQNVIGWNTMLKSFTSNYWCKLQSSLQPVPDTSSYWDVKLVGQLLQLSSQLWKDRNTCLHGTSLVESKIHMRSKVLNHVIELYANPPKLHKRFPKISSILLSVRLRWNTLSLQTWLLRVKHHKQVSQSLFAHSDTSQPTIQQAFARVPDFDMSTKKIHHN
jgi:hypothetical protein